MNIEEIKAELKEIKQTNEEEKQKIISNLERLEQKKTELLNGMNENLSERNEKAYAENNQELDRINALIKYNEVVLSEISTKALITKTKNTAYYNDIIKELNELRAQREAEIIKLIDKAKELINLTNNDINAGNDLLKDLQLNVYKDKSILNARGVAIVPLIKRYNEYLSIFNYTK